jgi:asparagine synthase (glutamine-hydrolysing)
MSGIAGIFQKDGRLVQLEMLAPLLAAVAGRGGDGSGVWMDGPAGLCQHSFWTVPEDQGVTGPLADEASGLAIVFDGRIDNREALLDDLEIEAGCPEPLVALHAYRRWGRDAPARLIGDFAFAIWDSSRRTLFCARDRLGVRPFYFADTPRAFVFASELQAVLRHPAVSGAWNEGMLAEVLAARITHPADTFFSDVLRLEPRHVLCVTAEAITRHCYWAPSFQERHFRSDAECAEELSQLLTTAVACRLRRTGPAAAFLSGGLDSSTITALACNLVPAGNLDAYTATYPGLAADESAYVDRFTARYPVRSHRVPLSMPPPDFYRLWAARYRDFPGYLNGNGLAHCLSTVQRENGVRVVLGGQGGNQLFDGSTAVIADLLHAWRFLACWKSARDYSYRGSPVWRTALRYGVRPLLPKPAWVRGLLGKSQHSHGPLDPDFVRRVNLADRLHRPVPDWRPYGSRARRDVAEGLFSALHAHHVALLDRDMAHYGIEERSPFFDFRLVEFALAIPERMRQRNGQWKYILRQAAAPYLPPEYLNRQVQAEFTEPALRIVASQNLPDLRLLEGRLSRDYLRKADNAAGVMEDRSLPVLQRWAFLGCAWFVEAEAGRR